MYCKTIISYVFLMAASFRSIICADLQKNAKKYTALRLNREAPVISSGGRLPGSGGMNYIRNQPNYQQVEVQQPYIDIVPSISPGGIGQGYPNAQSHSYTPTLTAYEPPSSGNYVPPLKQPYHQTAYTSPSQGNFDKYMTYSRLPTVMEYSGNGGSSQNSYGGGGDSGWHKSVGPPKYGWGWMKEEPVNFSAVGLLGLLALMGMIQHVMTDMDSVTMKPNSETSFVSGNSMGGRPKPTGGSTAKPKPRVRRSSDPEISLPEFLVARLSDKILPSYNAIAKGFQAKDSVMMVDCVRFHAWRIFKILTEEFQVPDALAASSISQSLKVMSENVKVSGVRKLWKSWQFVKPKNCLKYSIK